MSVPPIGLITLAIGLLVLFRGADAALIYFVPMALLVAITLGLIVALNM